MDFLCHVSITHWDLEIRELGSKALGKLVKTEPRYFTDNILPQIVYFTTNIR